jgi:hypothetical protein
MIFAVPRAAAKARTLTTRYTQLKTGLWAISGWMAAAS